MIVTLLHYSRDGGTTGLGSSGPYRKLLVDDATNVCLNCHDGTYVTEACPDVYNTGTEADLPGGDFDNIVTDVRRGHTLKALGTETDLTTAPGDDTGTPYTQANLSCVSCHDPHGTDSTLFFTFRNLKKDPNGDSTNVTANLSNCLEQTLVDGSGVNQAASATNHNVYRDSFGQWCAECHGTFHGTSSDTDIHDGTDYIRHPTDTGLTASMVTQYGNYDPMYPLIDGTNHITTSTTPAVLATDRVFCLSCHFAHAGPNKWALRWAYTAKGSSGNNRDKCHNK